MNEPLLPKNVKKIGAAELFSFHCHPGVRCFTDCCRQLELALNPYDVLRLRKATGLRSSEFLDRYVIIEQESNSAFPRFFLTMVDDGQASCVFVGEHGCKVYRDRPGACRAYPLGRAATLNHQKKRIEEFFILLRESHCLGFQDSRQQSPAQYILEQELSPYNRFNDAVAEIYQHPKVRQGISLTPEQIKLFTLALYDIDTFREKMLAGQLPHRAPHGKEELVDDETTLLFAIEWLKDILFG